MSQNAIKPEQIKSGVIVEIKFNDIDHSLFGLVLNVDHKARKKFVATGKGGYTVSVLIQERDGSFKDMIHALDSINHDQIVKVSEPINFSKLI